MGKQSAISGIKKRRKIHFFNVNNISPPKFKAIHVGAASPQPPQALIDQLAPGGRMLIPLGDYSQEFFALDKLPNGEIHRTHLADVSFLFEFSRNQKRTKSF